MPRIYAANAADDNTDDYFYCFYALTEIAKQKCEI